MSTAASGGTRAARPSLGHVGALDGVRALAVAGVVLYHGGVSWLHGGFLGVDVFFVLSGFLITSLLLREREDTGGLRLGRFYERRARRLLPGLLVLVLLVVAYADLVVPHGSFPSLPRQIVGTMLYVGNWTLIANHTTYFTMGLPPSPLEHTWSLAIEEQFYLVWPALLLVLTHLTRRREVLAACCALGALAAAAVTWWQYGHGTNLNTLYFSTQAHATTMLLGAAAACLVLRRRSSASPSVAFDVAPARARPLSHVVALAGWAGVLACFALVSGTTSFLYRGGYVAIGVLVAVAIVATVGSPGSIADRVLSFGPIAYLGRISYGVYLYHFPLFLWIDGERTHLQGPALLALRVAVTLAVATASYVLVEQPVRQRRVLRGRVGLVGAVAGFTAVGVLAFSAASVATEVPFFDRVAKWNPVTQRPPGTTTTVLIVGDSMARTLGAGLNNPIATSAHLFFAVNGVADCSLVAGTIRIKDFRVRSPARCDDAGPRGWPARWRRSLRRSDPVLTMLLFRLDVVDHRLFGRWQHVGDPQFNCVLRDRLIEAAAVLSSTGRPVALLTTPYYDSGEQADGAAWPEDAPSRIRAYNGLLAEVAASFPGVVHVVALGARVSPGGGFTRTIGATVVRWVDGIHFTYAGDAYVLPTMLQAVRSLAAAPPSRADLHALRAAAAAVDPAACEAEPRTSAS